MFGTKIFIGNNALEENSLISYLGTDVTETPDTAWLSKHDTACGTLGTL
jgi:hypothetical protein